jgi:4-methylaminobutanoate oxidase (formaldehyde-forming)
MLNERGGFESDLTLTRTAPDEYLIVSGSAQTTRDFSYIERRISREQHCVIVDVTGMYGVLAVMGPRSRELLSKVSSAGLATTAFPFGTSREIDLGYATVRATRLTYVGELGWELYTPVEQMVSVYEALSEAGRDLGLRDAGYYALESLRLEKGYRAWGRELTPDYTPLEAGLGFAVKLAKDVPFRGREALLKQRAQGLTRRMAVFTVADRDAILWGGEPIVRNGRPAGHLTSAAYGHTIGCAVGMGYVVNDSGTADDAFVAGGQYQVDIAGALIDASVHLRAPYDPTADRVRV